MFNNKFTDSYEHEAWAIKKAIIAIRIEFDFCSFWGIEMTRKNL